MFNFVKSVTFLLGEVYAEIVIFLFYLFYLSFPNSSQIVMEVATKTN
jgi:hypothetical protein